MVKKVLLSDKILDFLTKAISIQIQIFRGSSEGYKKSYVDIPKINYKEIRTRCIAYVEWKKMSIVKYNQRIDEEEQDTTDIEINYWDELDNASKKILRVIDVNEITENKDIFKNPTQLENKITKELTKNAKLLALSFTTQDNKKITLFKKISKNYFVFKESGFFAFIRGGSVNLFDDNLMKIPIDFDFIKIGNEILIYNVKAFEQTFKFNLKYENDFEIVSSHMQNNEEYEIPNLDKLLESIPDRLNHLRKFPSIKEKGIYTFSLEQLTEEHKNYPFPGVTIAENRIYFGKTIDLIRFFNDSKLYSRLTEISYIADDKTEIKK